MSLVRALTAGLRALFRKAEAERDLDGEVQHFIEMGTRERLRAGLSPEQALRAARMEVGGVEGVKELVRSGGWETNVESWWQDLAYGIRALRRHPAFTIVAVLTLALGVGASSAMFSVVNGVILRPLPYAHPRQLVMLWTDDVKRGIHESPTAIQTIDDWRADRTHFADIAVYRRNSVTVTTGAGDPERVRTVFAAPNLFPLLGVLPGAGRFFTENDNASADRVAVISDAFSQRRFRGADAVGKTLTLDGDMSAWKQDARIVRVIGVLPRGFYFPSKDVDVFEPIRSYWRYDDEATNRDQYPAWRAVGRLRPGVTAREGNASLTEIGKRLTVQYPASASRDSPGFAVTVVPVLDAVAGTDLQWALWVLLGTVGFVLLIACANVANLLLARGSVRDRELAIRLALGAGRLRILRQLLIESALLAAAGGALGLALAALALPALVAMAPAGIPRLDELSIDGRVLTFTLAATALAAVVFGVAPAWRFASAPPHEAIKGSSASSARRVLRLRGTLVVGECALAVVLLTGAGLLLRSYLRLWEVDPGFRPENVLVMRVSPPQQPPPGLKGEQVFAYQEARQHEMLQQIAAIPGVAAAGASGELMMSGTADESITFTGEAYGQRSRSALQLSSINVTEGFFEAMGARLRRGRFLTRADVQLVPRLLFTPMTPTYTGAASAVVVNDAFVQQFLDGRQPLGVRFYEGAPGKPFSHEIVGVIADMRRQGLETQPVPQYFAAGFGGDIDLVVRAAGNPLAFAPAVRAAVRAVDPATVILRTTTADQQLGAFTAERRFQSRLFALFAGVALLLASIGIYGVMQYSVEHRTREIGVRMALGASSGTIVRLIVSQGLVLTGIGIVVGIAAALSLSGVLSHWLFGIGATDSVTFAGTVVLLTFVAVLACWLPARRAATVDPIVALRSD
jgi:predicted permease